VKVATKVLIRTSKFWREDLTLYGTFIFVFIIVTPLFLLVSGHLSFHLHSFIPRSSGIQRASRKFTIININVINVMIVFTIVPVPITIFISIVNR
jgi:hypothetical protein